MINSTINSISVIWKLGQRLQIPVNEIITGGQSGVDLAALKAAKKWGIKISGYCPKGRVAEYGTIPLKYNLTETSSADPTERTILNADSGDATLIIVPSRVFNKWVDGTKLTVDTCKRLNKPYLEIALDEANNLLKAVKWLNKYNVQRLNVAGPRESSCEGGIEKDAEAFLDQLFALAKPLSHI